MINPLPQARTFCHAFRTAPPTVRHMPAPAGKCALPMKVQPGFKSLRAHDVHQGLQAAQIDRSSGLVGEELEATQLVGMAAALATGIKGIDYVADAVELKKIASQQYDIPTLTFPLVVEPPQ